MCRISNYCEGNIRMKIAGYLSNYCEGKIRMKIRVKEKSETYTTTEPAYMLNKCQSVKNFLSI